MKIIYSCFFFLLSTCLFSQNCIEFVNSGLDYLEINAIWIKKNQIKKIIEREYLKSDLEKVHSVNTLYYNDLGNIEKKIDGLFYPLNDKPNEKDFTSMMIYDYEMIDSFLYQKETVIRNFNENGRLEKQDTLTPIYKNNYNIYQKKYQTYEGEKLSEFNYNKQKQLISIKTFQGFENETILKYDKKKLIQVHFSIKSDDKLPFASDKKVELKYNSEGLISESSIVSQLTTQKYFYNKEHFMIRKELHMAGQLMVVNTYEYLK
jgi:hypothetical protein